MGFGHHSGRDMGRTGAESGVTVGESQPEILGFEERAEIVGS
jgi:hypothetical protein